MLLGRFKRAQKVFHHSSFHKRCSQNSLAPILILWYGVDIRSKVALATIIVFFIVQIPVMAAVSGVDPDLDTVATSMGATQMQKFKLVVILDTWSVIRSSTVSFNLRDIRCRL